MKSSAEHEHKNYNYNNKIDNIAEKLIYKYSCDTIHISEKKAVRLS